MAVRILAEEKERVETGPIRFGNDWAGLFIRGDNAAHYAYILGMLLEGKIPENDFFTEMYVKNLQQLLMSCDERTMTNDETRRTN
jgi:hypothetical protein